MYDVWNGEDRGDRGELFSNFLYSRLEGYDYTGYISRQDPSKVLKISGLYHVWYTCRKTAALPESAKSASEADPSTDWDLAEIWHATSLDGFHWEERGPAIKGPLRGEYGWRSASKPDILAWGHKYYLYYQAGNEVPGRRDGAAVTVAEADSLAGPWRPLGRPVVALGADGEWDGNGIGDPCVLIHGGRIHLYYQGDSSGRDDNTIIHAQGVAVADQPLGPFRKSSLNPVINSGDGTAFFPWRGGIAALVTRDGPEKNTIQYAPDGENFEMMSMIAFPPIAAGPFVPDAFADGGDGRGISWGLCHMHRDSDDGKGGSTRHTVLARFDCDLSRDLDRPIFKRNRSRLSEATYFQPALKLPDKMRSRQMANTNGSKPANLFVAAEAKRPTSNRLSAAMERMRDYWDARKDRGDQGELFSTFKYSRLAGFANAPNVSRRDPSKVIQVEGIYYVWYTFRRTGGPPVGPAKATDTVPSQDWDLADIGYATSSDGFTWEEQGIAVARPPKPGVGWRTLCTPDILAWKNRYYLFMQAYSEVIGSTVRCPVRVAVAASPRGPWALVDHTVVEPGSAGTWDDIAIHDPYPLVYQGKIYLYYKGESTRRELGDRMQGLAIADNAAGPFRKSDLNPVINSGHETALFPWRTGIAAIVTRDGPEKNTIQYAPDGLNFEVMSMIEVPPVAAGPFVPDAFTDRSDGRGITWGLCHIVPDGSGASNESLLVRFDCDLSRDVNRSGFNGSSQLPMNEGSYFQPWLGLPEKMRQQIISEQKEVDRETIMGRPRDRQNRGS